MVHQRNLLRSIEIFKANLYREREESADNQYFPRSLVYLRIGKSEETWIIYVSLSKKDRERGRGAEDRLLEISERCAIVERDAISFQRELQDSIDISTEGRSLFSLSRKITSKSRV